MCHQYTVHCIGTACFNHARSIIYVQPNAGTVPHLSYSAISATFNHQILPNVVMDFYICCQNSRKVTLSLYRTHHVYLRCFYSICQQYTLVYSVHVEYDKNNETIRPEVNSAARWRHRGSLGYSIEPDYSYPVTCDYQTIVDNRYNSCIQNGGLSLYLCVLVYWYVYAFLKGS